MLFQRTIANVEDAKSAAKELKKILKGTVIITLDKEGCVVYEKDAKEPRHIVTKPEESVDETAVGDIFRSVFFDYFLKSHSIDKALERALYIASRSTKIKGVDLTLTITQLD